MEGYKPELLLSTSLLELWKRQRGIYHLFDRSVIRVRTSLLGGNTSTIPLSHFCPPRNVFELRILAKVGANDPEHEGEQDLHDNLKHVIPC